MTVGESTTHADAILNLLRATNATGFTPYFKLHTGDPGANGTANASAETDRVAATFPAPSTVSTNRSTTAPAISWTAWNVGDETITHVSCWDAITAGTFRKSAQLSTPKSVQDGDTLNLTLTATQGPLAT